MKNSLYLLAGMMAMAAQGDRIFDTPKRQSRYIPTPPPKDLPHWKVGEHIIHAKDEKTALKYAKKRGYWKEGITIEKVDTE